MGLVMPLRDGRLVGVTEVSCAGRLLRNPDAPPIAPVVQTSVTAKYRNLTHSTQVVGTNTDWTHAMAFEIAEGRFLSDRSVSAR